MQKNKQLSKDKQILELLSQKETELVADELHISLGGLRAQLFRIRKRITEYQTYLNTIYALQRKSARVRKLTTSGALPEAPDEEEE